LSSGTQQKEARGRYRGLPFRIALCFALIAGLVEGLGLLVFQRINWRHWGPMMHVAKPIIWISPLVDVIFFLGVAGLIVLLGALLRRWAPSWSAERLNTTRVTIVTLTFLTAYDWLALTARLSPLSCVLFAVGVVAWINRGLDENFENENRINRFCRRRTPWLLAAWLLAFVFIHTGEKIAESRALANLPAASPGAPNVIVIVVDTLRSDHVSDYGYARQTTPNIDRIAKEGVKFRNAFAPSPWSLPSHASLLTGLYPFQHGMQNVEPMPWLGWDDHSLRSQPTLPEILQQHGYRTAAFSANRVYFTSNVGLGRGFIHFEDYFSSVADAFVRTMFGREFARIYLSRSDKSLVRRILRRLRLTSLLDRDTEGWENNGGARGVRKRANLVNKETLSWIEANKTNPHPFFIMLNYMDAHDPYGAPADFPKAEWDHGSDIDKYDEGIRYADHYVGLLTNELQQRGLLNQTLLVVTSDHGESLGEHGLHFHVSALYRELIQVPLIISYPGHLPAGLQVDTPVTNIGAAPTILDLLGISQPSSLMVPAVTPLWADESRRADWPYPIAEVVQNDLNPQKASVPTSAQGAMQSLITSDLHLIVHQKFGEQLYEWKSDSNEQNNLIKTSAGQAQANDLRSKLRIATRGSMP
jgi:arylsulfatase A-like enzyme